MNRQPSLLSRLIRRSRQIVLLTLVASIALISLIVILVRPTYEAYSLFRVEPAAPSLFAPAGGHEGGASLRDLHTQAQLIKSDQVVAAALENPLIKNFPSIKESKDPKGDLRRKLGVELVPDTYLIRVTLQSKNPTEAAVIVNAVVESHKAHIEQYVQGANRRLRESLEIQHKSLQKKILVVQADLQQLVAGGTVAVPATKQNGNNHKDSLKAAILNHQLKLLETQEDRVINYLAQLALESDQESSRLVLVDPASVPKTPADNGRIKLMAAAPAVAFTLILGLAVVFEVVAGRLAREAEESRARLRAESRDLLEGDYFPFKR